MDESEKQRPNWATALARGAGHAFVAVLDGAVEAAIERRIPKVRGPVAPAEVLSVLEEGPVADELGDRYGADAVVPVLESVRECAAATRLTAYPLPDRDHGGVQEVLADGRPAVLELWHSESFRYLALFFSVLDLEGASMAELTALVAPVLEQKRMNPDARQENHPVVTTLQDRSGNWIYSVTYVRPLPAR